MSSLKRFQGSLEKLELALGDAKSTTTPYVCQDFSVAECIAAPWVQRIFVTLPYYRSMDFSGDILMAYPKVERWMEAVRNKPSVIASMCPEDEMKAAAERYYVSFVTKGAPAAAKASL
mmetsp:Transcript_31991/g.52828  ORF Transcript_31991/g.52828 Transcript_31991/m.52828 type:complete len:118 (+) Transcript_31991:426-779(+)